MNYLQQSVSSIDQARGTLQQAKEQMNRGAAEAAAAAEAALPEEAAPAEEDVAAGKAEA